MKMYYIYQIRNLINGRIYVGVHGTLNLDDGYMGSGMLIKRAIEKYGIDNFEKEILQIFDTPKDMYVMESLLVDREFVSREDTYNLKEGGCGGWDYINDNNLYANRDAGGRVAGAIHKHRIEHDIEYRENWIKDRSGIVKQAWSDGKMKDWTGRRHSKESKARIGLTNSKLQSGEGNSQYGTCWIYNSALQKSSKIKKDDLDSWLQHGWLRGRKMKF